jgi:type IV pilus assembly protein PilC
MPEFTFQANDSDGQTITGELTAENVSAAIGELEERGLTVESIRLSTLTEEPSTSQVEPPRDGQPHSQHSSLEHQFGAAIERREILIPALTALADEMPSARARREMQQLVEALRQSRSAADLRLSKVATQWLPILVTGFTSESTTRRLSDLVAHTSREAENRSNRRRLLAYPFVVMVIAFAIFGFLCVFVVPTFGNMFDEFGLHLPASTYVVLAVSNEMRLNPIQFAITVSLIAGVIYGLFRLWVHFALTTRLFGLFTAGNSAGISAMSSLTSRLAELLSIDVSVADALWFAGQGCGHYHFKEVAEQLARHAQRSTEPLSSSPVAHNFPANVIYALEGGTDGQPNVALLRELSTIYSDRAAQRIDWTTGAIAQIAIVVVGIAVGFVVIALFTPLVSMVSSLS